MTSYADTQLEAAIGLWPEVERPGVAERRQWVAFWRDLPEHGPVDQFAAVATEIGQPVRASGIRSRR